MPSWGTFNILHFNTILMLLTVSLWQTTRPNKYARFAHGWFGLTKYSVCLKYGKKCTYACNALKTRFFPLNELECTKLHVIWHFSKPFIGRPRPLCDVSCLQRTAHLWCLLSKVWLCAITDFYAPWPSGGRERSGCLYNHMYVCPSVRRPG